VRGTGISRPFAPVLTAAACGGLRPPWSGSGAPSGRLVDVLLEAGHPVAQVKPNAIKGWPESEVLSGAKSDTRDAAVIAECLRLCHHRLQ
jgi:hypothetical protein